jgi:adenosylcobinamide-phosphate synthase
MMGPSVLVAPGAIIVALWLDRQFGEPPASIHPVVLIGRLLAWIGLRILKCRPAVAFFAGTLAWLVMSASLIASTVMLESRLAACLGGRRPWVCAASAAVVNGLLLKPLFAWRMLRDEVRGVEAALARSLRSGRAQVARIAGRDTAALSAIEVRETAIESLAENLTDSVVAPLFWYAVAGLPGAVLYRYANTADAMWGKRGEWEWAGKWAARADDVLSFFPARLTALAIAPPGRWRSLRVEARQLESPNGGWPIGATALRLGVRLGRPGFYVLNAAGRAALPADTERALAIATAAVFTLVPVLTGIAMMCAVDR